MKTISICIPTYEMKGLGTSFLAKSFDILALQTYTDFDIVVSDHSTTDDIKDLCARYSDRLDIQYHRNEYKRGNSSANINNAMKNATGRLIKILFQDDFLFDEYALAYTVERFDKERGQWLASACTHSHDGIHFYWEFHPRYNPRIYLGNNTISSPSVITIKNDTPLFFDESLIWLMDVEYYKRLYDTYGGPVILPNVTVVNRTGAHQVSNTLATKKVRLDEYLRVLKRYEHGVVLWYHRMLGYLKNLLQ